MSKFQLKIITRKIIAIALCVLFLISTFVPCVFAETNTRTVRVAYGFNDFIKVDENGKVSGHYAELLEKLEYINSWNFEYVKLDWNSAVEGLKDGTIDILFPTNYFEEREKFMDFASLPIGYAASGLFALEDSDFEFEDYSAFNNKKIAYAKNSNTEIDLALFAQEHGFTYEPVYINTNEEMVEALEKNEADLAVFSAANDFENGMLVAVMEAKPVYFTVKKGNTELLNQINYSMQVLLETEPDLVADVFRLTIVGNNVSSVALTKEEKEFIASGKEIKIGFYKDTEPLAFVNSEGTYGGIYIEILNKIKNDFGLNIVLVPISRDRNWKELVNSGEIDFYVGSSNVIVSRDDDIRMTDSFLEYSNVLITRNDCAFNKIESPVIALTYARAYWADYLKEHLGKNIDIKFYQTAKECMLAVTKKEADGTVMNNLEFNYHSKNPRLATLILWPQYRYPTAVSFAADENVDEIMFSTFNKMIGHITSDYTDAVTEEWVGMAYNSYTTSDYIYNARYTIYIFMLVIIAIFIIILVFRRSRKNQEKIRKEAIDNEKHQLEILSVTSYEYSALYYVDLDQNTSQHINHSSEVQEKLGISSSSSVVRKYTDSLEFFANTYVKPEYRDGILKYTDKDAVLKEFMTKPRFSVRYIILPDARNQSYFEMIFLNSGKNDEGHNMMVLGIRCIDDMVKEEQEQTKLLQDALDGANRANSAKSEFLSRMSHDIRTPMNAIIGMTAIAESHIEDPERVQDSLKKISNASRHLLGLINDILDMSKIEAGKMHLVEENIDLVELVNNLLDIVRPQIKEHRHTLSVNVQDVIHEKVIGDGLRIQQAFLNLMGNAIKYTPDGGKISFTVREKALKVPHIGCYEFVFRDNGIGMSKEVQKHIFESFTRSDDEKTVKIQGTGLGLSITRNIVQMMNGNIQVQSEVNKGSTFTMTIFLKLREEEELDLSRFKDLKVLVVDDIQDNCDYVCQILNSIGMKSESCISGREAIEKVKDSLAKSEPFDAIILDWKMPEMDGMETTKRIKEITKGELPIVILSAYDWSEIEDEARNIGVNSFFSKPVFRSDVIRVFKMFVNDKGDTESDGGGLDPFEESDFSGRRVLLAEDNELNREIARELLSMANIIIDEAENGRVAVEKFAASEIGFYDIILMDIQMPEMNGYEASAAIRSMQREDAATVPIVAMTANAFVEDIQASEKAGMNEHLSKPIDFDKFAKALKKYLN